MRGKLINPDDVGYDVILLAGQSNMSGRGAGYDNTRLDLPDPRIFQYGNSGTWANTISSAIEPLAMHDTPSGMGPGLQFARWYAHTVPGNRRILLVPAAHGGTGFRGTTVTPTPAGYTTVNAGGGTWEVGGAGVNLYENAISQANSAISAAGPNSRIVAILWHQGENDAGWLNQAEYAAELDELIDGFRARITGAASVPFILGQLLPEMVAANPSWAMINAAHVDTPRRKLRTAFAYGLAGANNGDNLHYNAAGARFMGRAMFDRLPAARANALGSAPGPVTNVVLVQSGTSLLASWTRPITRVTDYEVQWKPSSSSSWTTLTRPQSLEKTATITGLSRGTDYDVRVRSANEQGYSAWSATASLALANLPGAVTGLVATGGGTSLSLTWNAYPAAVTYLVEYKAAASGTWLTGPTPTASLATINGLTPSTDYDVRVSATTAAGTGSPSTPVTQNTGLAGPSLLNAITATPARAYSLRRLKNTYAGAAVRVRRSTDNTETDVWFIGNDLDSAALLAFAGSGSAFVVTWYDQSGSGRHLTQATTTSQARVVNNGVQDKLNGQPSAVYASSYYSDAFPGMWAAGAASVLAVLSAAPTGAAVRVCSEASTAGANPQYTLLAESTTAPYQTGVAFGRDDAASTVMGAVGATDGPGIWVGSGVQVSSVDTGTSAAQYVNGAAGYTQASYSRAGKTITLNNFTLGAMSRVTVASFFAGSLPELVVWNSDLSTADRQAGEANQKAYYGTL